MKLISSSDNARFKQWKSLLTSKGLKKEQLCIVSGKKLILEILEQNLKRCQTLLFSKNQMLNDSFEQFDLERMGLDTPLFKELDELGTHQPLLIFDFSNLILPWNSSEPSEELEVFCPLGDPANLGALLRSCEAFGVKKVILLKESAHPFLPKSLRASSGSALRIPLCWGPAISELNFPLIGLDMEGTPLDQCPWPHPTRLLLGEEGLGLPRHLPSMTTVRIPMQGSVESLNAATAASIILYEWQRRR
ncbi:MAG: RNA methyltransferase [Bdellovibrionales bacterium]|nr:RNA methyltransferase [Bdellovibrionales bacterium]